MNRILLALGDGAERYYDLGRPTVQLPSPSTTMDRRRPDEVLNQNTHGGGEEVQSQGIVNIGQRTSRTLDSQAGELIGYLGFKGDELLVKRGWWHRAILSYRCRSLNLLDFVISHCRSLSYRVSV